MGMSEKAVVNWMENRHSYLWQGVGDQRWNQETNGASGN